MGIKKKKKKQVINLRERVRKDSLEDVGGVLKDEDGEQDKGRDE